MRRSEKRYAFGVVSVFMLALYLPFIGSIGLPAKEMSLVEKRKLAVFPEMPTSLSSLAQYTKKLENYYNDHFGFREELIFLHNLLKFSIGESPDEQVVMGKNGWFFLNGTVWDFRNAFPLKDSELDRWAFTLQTLHGWLEKRGIGYIFVIAPNKATIYGENMPDWMTKVGSESIHDKFISIMDANTAVSVLDLRKSLIERKGKLRLYHKTDSHWNLYGANVAQYEIARRVAGILGGKVVPKLWDVSDFQLRRGNGLDLANMMGLKTVLKEDRPFINWKKCAFVIGKNESRKTKDSITTECPKSDARALVFQDSFFNSLRPFFSEYFGRVTYIRKDFSMEDFIEFVEEEEPDIIIHEVAEIGLREPPNVIR